LVSTSTLFVLGLTSTTLAQVQPPKFSITESPELAQPISTKAADLLEKPISTVAFPALEEADSTATFAQTEIQPENQVENSTENPTKTPQPIEQPIDTPQPIEQPIDTPQPVEQPTNTPESVEIINVEQGVQVPASLNEGAVIDRIFIYLRNPTDDTAKDEAYKQQIAETFDIQAGSNFSSIFADLSLRQVQKLPFVKTAEYRLYQADTSGRIILAVLVTLQGEPTKPDEISQKPRGILVNGDFSQFPTWYESDRALVKTILNAGFGVFSDTNPWFGSTEDFVAGSYQPKGTITWPEFYIEPGIGGITQIGEIPLYVYGAVSYLESASLAPDIFRSDTRFYGDIEKLYGGFLFAQKGSPVSFNLSVGRQNFQLNRNFLFGQVLGSANALERGASFLNARTVYDNAVLGNLRLGNFLIQGFYLDPDELPISESNSRFLGVNLKYNDNRNIEAALAYITIPESDSLYVFPDGQRRKREGLQVINPRLRWTNPFGIEGLWVESEYAYEWNNNFAMSAHAGYIWAGYTFQNVPWRPSISYRFAGFSGDDPRTSAYERFDSLRGGGLGDWLQGISLAKVYGNANLLSHRVEFKVNPTDKLQLSLDYFYLFSDRLNNLGGRPVLANLQSHSIGHEVMLTTRWSISQNLFLLGVGAIAFPDDAIRRAVTEDTSPWLTFQVSLFLGF
jgi:hypothetical protein